MKSKATAKEMVGTKIVYAMLLVCYYWMWARRDWLNYYDSIQNAIFMFSFLYFLFHARRFYQYRKEEKDREAIQILRRIDAIGLKIMVAAAIAIAFASAVAFIDGIAAGYALVGTILAFAILRFVLFCAMYKKEI